MPPNSAGRSIGVVLGAGDFVGVSDGSLLGFCDGWELGTVLGAGDLVGGSETTLLGFCEGCDEGVLDG
jgi:hypothetical protein